MKTREQFLEIAREAYGACPNMVEDCDRCRETVGKIADALEQIQREVATEIIRRVSERNGRLNILEEIEREVKDGRR